MFLGFFGEDKKGIQNKTKSPTRIFASITNVETTMSIAINCFAPSFIFYHLELLTVALNAKIYEGISFQQGGNSEKDSTDFSQFQQRK